ncbi:lysosomal alpha-mannosidase [Lingula anatina]|uniref:Alpha-mannosidase n=1 Tax=Lingula anatina TaxID=7574 RepID=A0A1S3IXF1_LINAN|nr:lysosomal alpha-mannosidase [Lingula anatina]|eukprot:XP_013402708.1 lysosomal alpha-mannosidase [Lingula anatina]
MYQYSQHYMLCASASRMLLMCCLSLLAVHCVLLGTISALPADASFYKQQMLNGFHPQQKTDTCGYKSCNLGKDGMINVHLVPHTHDDVGWLKTVDQYFYGANNTIQHAGVQYILDSVVEALGKDPNKRFIYVEIAFFYRWWNEQDDPTRHFVKGLVNQGRLEFILGGWCMNDEASTHYNAIIDQHTEGFRFLETVFGDCGRPRVAWQIDPFGHSREMASLFAQMGFDGLYFARLDYQDRAVREKDKRMEMVWRGSPQNLGTVADLFTGALARGNYGPPGGFCWDVHCNDNPVQDDKRLHDYNVDDLVKKFLATTQEQAKQYQTNHLMWTMGSDFQFESAHQWYKNLDKLITYVNAQQANGSKVNALYSTPSCYTYAKNLANVTWTTKEDDFFPYAHVDHGFWTGYFTSRAALKGYVRWTNNFLQGVKQLDILSKLDTMDNSEIKLRTLRQAMGVAQHHDAVSGTEKQHVAYDYAMRLSEGISMCQEVVNDAYKKLLPKNNSATPPVQMFCTLTNISMCNVTELLKRFTVTVYNPIGRPVTTWLRLPVQGSAYTVIGPDGKNVPAQIVPVSKRTKSIPERKSPANYELVFHVSPPPLGFATYFVSYNSALEVFKQQQTQEKENVFYQDMDLRNEHISLIFDQTTGLLKQMTNLDKQITIPLQHEFKYYQSFAGNNSKGIYEASGAYIFRPNGTDAYPLKTNMVTKFMQGILVKEVHQTFSSWTTLVTRLYQGARHVEMEWTVGPIPIDDNQGKEVISHFATDLKTNGIFYTDSNGREILQRKRNFRPTWKLNQTEPVSGNYYPINSRIYIRDETKNVQLTVLNDRSQGGSSIQDGCLEIMVHRRNLHDDSLGVGEPLNETGSDGKGLIVRGKHYLVLDDIKSSGRVHRDLAEQLFMAPLPSFSDLKMDFQQWIKQYNTMWSGLKQKLPDNVHLLTLEQWSGTTVLLRLEHFYEKGEDDVLSKPAVVSLKGLFTPFDVSSAVELNLGANQKLADMKRLKWMYKTQLSTPEHVVTPIGDDLTVQLQPMQIRTFQVTLA